MLFDFLARVLCTTHPALLAIWSRVIGQFKLGFRLWRDWLRCRLLLSLYTVIKIWIKIFLFYCTVHSIPRPPNVKRTKNDKTAVLLVYCLYKKICILPENDSWFFHFLVKVTKKRKMEWTRHFLCYMYFFFFFLHIWYSFWLFLTQIFFVRSIQLGKPLTLCWAVEIVWISYFRQNGFNQVY